jgi:hypothetical protein
MDRKVLSCKTPLRADSLSSSLPDNLIFSSGLIFQAQLALVPVPL